MSKAKLYLIPNTLGDTAPDQIFGKKLYETVENIDHFIVEHQREARRFLIKLGFKEKLEHMHFYVLNKHTEEEQISTYLNPIFEDKNVGIISDAGCPGIADPGAEVVAIAHKKKIRVVPLVGPSSILLALISSGLGGQEFSFNGYLPKDQSTRNKHIRALENASAGKTQIFMETPYRNMNIVEDLLNTLSEATNLCIACDLNLATEYIVSKKVAEWKKTNIPNLNKRPCIFLIRRS